MLTGLQLRNIALIDSLELVFQAGFTVLTGETGAGKSILLDAIDAVLGGAQGAAGLRLLRPGCDLSRIEASFEITEPVGRWLSREGLADDGQDELIVSREWRRQQPERVTSRSRLNGVAVNRQQLQDLRPLLIDLTIQGQTQQLSRSGQQRRWLDRLGGAGLAECSQEVRTAWQLWREAAASLLALEDKQEGLERDRAEQEQLLDQLEQACLEDPDEWDRLQREQDRLVHGVHLQQGLAEVFGRLRDGADQAPSLQDHFAAVNQELQAMSQMDASLIPLHDRALDLQTGVEDLLRSLDQYGVALESDPEQLLSLIHI